MPVDEDVPEADPKVTKQEFAYVYDEEPRRCGTCNMFYDDKCTLVEGDIDGENGVCAYWAKRRTKPKTNKKYEPMLSKEESGYLETPGGTKCETCKFFRESERACEMVMGDIDPLGCCIAWTPNEETATEGKYFKIFKKVDLS